MPAVKRQPAQVRFLVNEEQALGLLRCVVLREVGGFGHDILPPAFAATSSEAAGQGAKQGSTAFDPLKRLGALRAFGQEVQPQGV